MPKKVAKGFVRVIVILMIAQCFLAAFATPISSAPDSTSVSGKSLISLVASSLFAEIEEEKSEEETGKACAVELADYSKNISFLSKIHTPHLQFVAYEHFDDHQPSLFQLFCVFVI